MRGAGHDRSDASSQVGWGSARSKSITWHDPLISASAAQNSSGIEFLRAIRDGQLAPPPIANLMGFGIVDVEFGRVVFDCIPDESLYNPFGIVHGGLVCTLADTVIACSVQTTLDAGVNLTSIDLNVNYLRPVTTDSGRLVATGLLNKPGRRVAYATAEILNGAGQTVATATGACFVMEGPILDHVGQAKGQVHPRPGP